MDEITTKLGNLKVSEKTAIFTFSQKSQKPFIPKSMSINRNLALIRALYVSGGLMQDDCI